MTEDFVPTSSPSKRMNFWAVTSAILLIAFIAALFLPSPLSLTGKAVMIGDEAGQKIVKYINENLVQDGNVTFSSSKDLGTLYEIKTNYNGQEIIIYSTKDGKYFMQGAVDTDKSVETPNATAQTAASTAAPVNVTKSDKPVADAYVFSYCPYGLQFEKALSPVYSLLKDAEINLVFIGAMHGEYEKVESLRQICVQKEYDKDKLFAYLDKFNADNAIGACSSNANCSLPLVEALMESLSIDKAKIESCMESDAEALYNADMAKAKSAGVSGSPTFLINGAKVQVARSPEAIKKAICAAYTEAPSECSETLSATAASAGFGSGASASSGGGCGA